MPAPPCAATTQAGTPCKRQGRFDGYCGTHQRCSADGCRRVKWWECSPRAFCRPHAGAHAVDCDFCGDHYRRTVGGWYWPLRARFGGMPDAPGRFGAVRKHDIHTGVDLYCRAGAAVMTVEPGEVVAVEDFTGPDAGSPWWLPTKAVLVEGASGVVVYGEVEPVVSAGARLGAGTPVGTVLRVLRKDKGLPRAMLHLELMVLGARETVWWKHGEARPGVLRDPTAALQAALDR